MRLLDGGVTVSRTASDLARYHDKLLIIDRRAPLRAVVQLHASRRRPQSRLRIVTRKPKLVQEALRLLAADTDRTRYDAGLDTLVVSPANARQQLLALIRRPERAADLRPRPHRFRHAARPRRAGEAGVYVRVIGTLGGNNHPLHVRPLYGLRLHARTIIRDRREAFVGSQSLRKAELNARREVGIIVRDSKVVRRLHDTFEADWAVKKTADTVQATPRALKKAMKETVEKLSPLDPLVKGAVDEVVSKEGNTGLNAKEVKETVERAVKEAVRERVQEMLNESAEP
jgi:phosphatidylserine/phosphatidylglycerophosphate/cardiolipin synthase-like enzyme